MSSDRTIGLGIVVYNTELSVLTNTFSSLERSTIPIEVVIHCNSPIGDYQRAVEEITLAFGFKLMKDRPNKGFGAGHNEIWRDFKTKWYVCCNPDVFIKPNAIEELIKFGEAKHNLGLLMPKVLNKDGSIQPLARRHPTLFRWLLRQLWRMFPNLIKPYEVTFDYNSTQPVEFVTGCFFAVKLETMNLLGGFDEEFFLYAEDADLARRAETIGQNYFVAASEVTHLWSTKWSSNPRAVISELKSLLRYFIKHK